MNTSIYSTPLRGKTTWLLAWTDTEGARRRRYFADRANAESARANLDHQAALAWLAWLAWLALSARQRAELIAVADRVLAAGLSLRVVWDAYRVSGKPVSTITLGAAVWECVVEKRTLGRRPVYVAALEYTLDRFAKGREKSWQ